MLVDVFIELKEYPLAITELQKQIEIQESTSGQDHLALCSLHKRLGDVYRLSEVSNTRFVN